MPVMLLDALLKGIVAGIIVPLPVGPVGVLCMRRTLFEGVAYGLISGLGATFADTLYGTIAGFGNTMIRDSLLLERNWLGAAAGLFLLAAGGKVILKPGTYRLDRLAGERLAYAFGSAFLLTLANPFTILVFAAIFSQIGVDAASGYAGIGLSGDRRVPRRDAELGGIVFRGEAAAPLRPDLARPRLGRGAGGVRRGAAGRFAVAPL